LELIYASRNNEESWKKVREPPQSERAMLKLNLSRLTGDEIAEVIAAHCARFGLVKSVVISETKMQQSFALVTMDSEGATRAVVDIFGDGWIDDKVIVRLEQDEQFIPRSLLRHPASPD
jgi:hypothetical protein